MPPTGRAAGSVAWQPQLAGESILATLLARGRAPVHLGRGGLERPHACRPARPRSSPVPPYPLAYSLPERMGLLPAAARASLTLGGGWALARWRGAVARINQQGWERRRLRQSMDAARTQVIGPSPNPNPIPEPEPKPKPKPEPKPKPKPKPKKPNQASASATRPTQPSSATCTPRPSSRASA